MSRPISIRTRLLAVGSTVAVAAAGFTVAAPSPALAACDSNAEWTQCITDAEIQEYLKTEYKFSGSESLSQMDDKVTYIGKVPDQGADPIPVTGVTSLEGLDHLPKLAKIALSGSSVDDFSSLKDIPLTDLYLEFHKPALPSDALAKLTHLDSAILVGNSITKIPDLSAATNLTALEVYKNGLTNLDGLETVSKTLTHLNFGDNKVASLPPEASGFTNLRHIDGRNNLLTDIDELKGITTLQEVFLDNNQIASLEPLRGNPDLDIVDFTNNRITDLTPLAGANGIEKCYFDNQVSVLDPTTANVGDSYTLASAKNGDGSAIPVQSSAPGAGTTDAVGVTWNNLVEAPTTTYTLQFAGEARLGLTPATCPFNGNISQELTVNPKPKPPEPTPPTPTPPTPTPDPTPTPTPDPTPTPTPTPKVPKTGADLAPLGIAAGALALGVLALGVDRLRRR